MTNIPTDLKIYSAVCASPDGQTQISLRFLMSPEELQFAIDNQVIPEDTSEVLEIQQFDQPVHDWHGMPNTTQ
jgi:hypothetical protein